ncbi:hypothetical protein PGTUg99_004402 [Puccinia graminis f. sp. tritici]|uniref:Uncharacterized protein n=1 Tax=Puccinia graminis f. sp. tritici TaxID=56615 RepID=A0A5B0QYW4_PUCGR|nr:hypothetical protein PGTUg99_004402 [Puccinia graminis f. sp. tritici]
MKQVLFCPQTGPCYSLFLFTMLLLRMVDAHAGITKPPSMQLGNEFSSKCGLGATAVIKKDNFISQELWKKQASSQCKARRCQGLFLKDQDLSKVTNFPPGKDIPVTIKIVVPHVGKAQLFLIDMQGKKQDLFLMDLGDQFGKGKAFNSFQDFQVKLPSEKSKDCVQPGKCAIA